MQAEKAFKYIESYKKIKNSYLIDINHQFPSVDSYYKRIFSDKGLGIQEVFNDRSTFAIYRLNNPASPKKEKFKLSHNQGYFSPKIESKRSLSPIFPAINTSILSN